MKKLLNLFLAGTFAFSSFTSACKPSKQQKIRLEVPYPLEELVTKKEYRINLDKDKPKEVVYILEFQDKEYGGLDKDFFRKGGILILDDDNSPLYNNLELWEHGVKKIYFLDMDKDGTKEIVLNFLVGPGGYKTECLSFLKLFGGKYDLIFEIPQDHGYQAIYVPPCTAYSFWPIGGFLHYLYRGGFGDYLEDSDIGNTILKFNEDEALFIRKDSTIIGKFDDWIRCYVYNPNIGSFNEVPMSKNEIRKKREQFDPEYKKI